MSQETSKTVELLQIDQIASENGRVVKYFSGQSESKKEVYLSEMRMNIINAWKVCKSQPLRIYCVIGEVDLIYKQREQESINKVKLTGTDNNIAVIPPGIYYGFDTRKSERDVVILNSLKEEYRSIDYSKHTITELEIENL